MTRHLFIGGPLDGQYVDADGTTAYHYQHRTLAAVYQPVLMGDGPRVRFVVYVEWRTPITARLLLRARQAHRLAVAR